MNNQEKRQRFRDLMAGGQCTYPASVYDPLSARMADGLGQRVGMLAGSVASAVVVGAPDLVVLTLTEFADLIRRITRSSDLSLIVDADHGYGNALSVMRTVEELETAGVAALTIEDTLLPEPFRKQAGQELLPVEEGIGKMKAALAARKDPGLFILGRTSALNLAGMEEALRRAKAYTEAGVDGIFLTGVNNLQQLQAVREGTSLPLFLGTSALTTDLANRPALAENGVRLALLGHQPFWASVKAAYQAMKHLAEGGAPDALQGQVASRELTDMVTRNGDYTRWRKEFLG
ncbi:MAG: isocitrate lyase/phosphoenolpyruvate mutase family protein [Chloroflexi bacterium]|nr:isocitrate lyase/phosphoenolpyruvate mutase family protein [Chloroflexota bacterium]